MTMLKYLLFFLTILGVHVEELSAQELYKGVVIDAANKKPIPFNRRGGIYML